jgi:hypothetical protein
MFFSTRFNPILDTWFTIKKTGFKIFGIVFLPAGPVRCGLPPPADHGAAAGRAGEAAAVTAGEAATAVDKPSVAGSALVHSPKEQKKSIGKYCMMKYGTPPPASARVPDWVVLTG